MQSIEENLLVSERAPHTHPIMKSPQEIRDAMTGLSESSIAAALAFAAAPDRNHLESCVLGFLEGYRPKGSPTLIAPPLPDTRLREELGIDSLSMAEALFKVDEVFDVPIESSEAVDLETWADLISFLEKKLQQAA